MRVLVLGSGGREHAMVHALAGSPSVSALFAAPGNPGMASAAELLDLDISDPGSVAAAAAELEIDLTVVGPEAPLAAGIGDVFAERGLRLFGPTAAGAELEASKAFAKEFCFRHGIPTAAAEIVSSAEDARRAAAAFGFPVVLKADGLAAGKGVLIVQSKSELDSAIDELFVSRRFGSASDRVLVEECLRGIEVSFMVISDGRTVEPFATSHDYKRVGDGDSGPNTGGMGSHSPAFALSADLRREIEAKVIRPTVDGMAAEGREYRGILYAGLMLTDDGPKVLEFNCRLGDPETQATFLRLDDNFAEVARDAADGALEVGNMNWRKEAVACVVLAAEGYPGSPRKGDEICGVDDAMALSGVTVYHAGTRLEDGNLATSGGRVLSVCGRGSTLSEALDAAYGGVSKISFNGMWYRSDIGRDTLDKLGT